MSLFKNVNVVQIVVTDWERAKEFYTRVLEWPVAFAADEVGWMEFGRDNEAHVAINRWAGEGPAPSGQGATTLVLTVDDAHETARVLRGKGVRCDDVTVIPGMVAYGTFYDPDGNAIQFAASEAPPG